MIDLYKQAKKVIPGGVSSPVRSFENVDRGPIFASRGKGAYIFDESGNKYIDYIYSWGPNILGHANKKVIKEVIAAAKKGLSFGLSTKAEIILAQIIVDLIKPIEKVRFVSTGTEAAMTAVRLMRGKTSRNKIIKFEGCYHGHSDSMLIKSGSGLLTHASSNPKPSSSGVTQSLAQDTIVCQYNNKTQIKEAFEKYKGQIAGIITEAAPCNMGVVAPDADFNSFLADIAHCNGALLCLDEVLTGFRASKTGYFGYENKKYAPDLFIFGKVIGGGLPIAAVAGKSDILDLLSPLGPVYQAGTLSANPLAIASGIATLSQLSNKVYNKLDKISLTLQNAIKKEAKALGVKLSVSSAGNLFSVFFGIDSPPKNYDDVLKADTDAYKVFFKEMLKRGILLPPSPFEAIFVSYALSSEELNKTIAALKPSLKAVLNIV